MKRLIKANLILLASLLLLSSCAGSETKQGESDQNAAHPSDEIKVMTFNIRLDTPVDSLNVWANRLPKVDAFLDSISPDVLGAQEVLHNQLQDLLAALPGYEWYGVGRTDGKEEGEYQPLFWKKDRFEALDKGHFWLSATPNEPSFGWDAACERTAVWALLRDKETGEEILFLNTHLDHIGEVARINSITMIKDSLISIAGDRDFVAMGDFNADKETNVIKAMLDNGNSPRRILDTRSLADEVLGPEWSWHDFGREPVEKRELIDFIFLSAEDPEVRSHAVLAEEDAPDHLYLSDHAPVLVRMAL